MTAELTITLTETGEIVLKGPLNNKLLCFGLLKAAELQIAAYVPRPEPLVKPVSVMPFPKAPA